MVSFGICAIPTDYTIQPVEYAKWAEANAIESLWFGEHTHIPVSRISPWPVGGDLPDYYARFFDPFIGLTAAAAVTTTLKIGTSVTLIPEHNPITLAKQVSCLDRVSNGRFLFAIGAGWNVEELANHGVDFKDRWKVTRERVLAMREIWSKDEAEYHGQFVNFDKIWQWPKPLQKNGPPVLMGAASKWTWARIAEYCDGWFAPDLGDDMAAGIVEIKKAMQQAGRSMDGFDFTVMNDIQRHGVEWSENRIPDLIKLGFNRIVLLVNADTPENHWPLLEQCARIAKKYK